MLKIARRGEVDSFIVMEVMREANLRTSRGEGILHLEVGQPSTPAPGIVRAAAVAALESNRIGYTDALGVPELRGAISRHYRDFYQADIPAERVVVTTGSSGAFLLAFLASFDPGDRVALASPGYPCYRNILKTLGIDPILLPMSADSKFQPTLDALGQYHGTPFDGLIIASPSNPVGAVIQAATLGDLSAYCRAQGVRLISDEIYHGITFGAPAATMASIDDQSIVVNSFSKYFSMTGWRLGWLVLPPSLVQPVERLAQNLFISPPTLSQYAAIAAFDAHEELQQNVRRYAANRDILLNGLPEAGFDRLIATDGAFYVYADVSALTDDSVAFAQRILAEAGIAVTPGVDFDPQRGHHFLRFSFAGATEDMAEAVRRLKNWRK
ncbi:pyridoxal phosphate-dependent aminotransferase [Dongia soli]|uniref:Aminotransferase n=1 Tax=Dongia soli TaxID=600628 RepID=A0ABU5EBF3_9PROT|nr:aminotransferase class I/II-fold pyridoxal phosphate-dependent enzyme [Dongia soli]MDY0883705.1 aminotransferase class I/II-fold pyridoxal phosphate-dependent enzyme [Dongia soli]